MDKLNICLLSAEYAFEYPRPGEYLFPFKVVALALAERGCNVTVVCLGPNLDVSYKGIRLKAVQFNPDQDTMNAFGPVLQIWQYYSAVRRCLNNAVSELAKEMRFDVIECCGITAVDAIFQSDAACVLRLNEARIPSMAPSDHIDINVALLRMRQNQIYSAAHAYLNERKELPDDKMGHFLSADYLERLTFGLSTSLPDPIVPQNEYKSILVGQWFMDSSDCRELVVEVAAKLQQHGVKARFLFPCHCNSSTVTSEPHCEVVRQSREYARILMGTSHPLWVIHNLKSSDILNCLSISEAAFIPSSKDVRFHELDSLGFASSYYGKPAVTSDASQLLAQGNRDRYTAALAEELESKITANTSRIDAELAEATKQTLKKLVDLRLAAYNYGVDARNRSGRAVPSDDLAQVLEHLDRLASTTTPRPSLASKLRRRLEHFRRKANEVRS